MRDAGRGTCAPLRKGAGEVTDRFDLVSDFELRGDQPRAIGELVDGLERGDPHQVLLGRHRLRARPSRWRRSIARVNRPTLVMVHNKTLAAQLYQEFRRFFPDNAVEYFVSYYDYYQPEAYVPATDTYIEKEATINDEIDRMRLSATRSLFERRDVIIVASVSCIYGLGSPEAYFGMMLPLELGPADRARADPAQAGGDPVRAQRLDFGRGTFRVRGDIVEVYPSYEEQAVRIELFGDEVDELVVVRPAHRQRRRGATTGSPSTRSRTSSTPRERTRTAIESIKAELVERRSQLEREGKLLEAQRLHQRTMFDLEMMREIGYCHGIENYARHLTGRAPGRAAADAARLPAGRRGGVRRREPPDRPADPRDVPRRPVAQGGAGQLRLPPAVRARQPAAELRGVGGARRARSSSSPRRRAPSSCRAAGGVVVEQIIRPTGLIDPPIEVRPVKGQVDDLLDEIRDRAVAQRAGAGHDADQADGRGPDAVLPGARRPGPLPALGHRHARAGGDPARPAARRVRRARRDQPAAGGARPARGVAGGDPRRRQGRVPALGRVAHPDVRPRRAERERPGRSCTPTR